MQNCVKCNSSGQIVVQHKLNHGFYAFVCNACEIALTRKLGKSYPKWNDLLVATYDVFYGSRYIATLPELELKYKAQPKPMPTSENAFDSILEAVEPYAPDFYEECPF